VQGSDGLKRSWKLVTVNNNNNAAAPRLFPTQRRPVVLVLVYNPTLPTQKSEHGVCLSLLALLIAAHLSEIHIYIEEEKGTKETDISKSHHPLAIQPKYIAYNILQLPHSP
jgi:hypothetical protein